MVWRRKQQRKYFFLLLCKVSLGFLKGAIQIKVLIIITVIIKNVLTCTEKKLKTSVLHFYFVTCKCHFHCTYLGEALHVVSYNLRIWAL